MVRKQVYIEARQEALLKRHARARGTTEAELIRWALDRALSEAGAGINDRAWQDALSSMRSRRRVKGQKRSWRREELYDRA
jgi:hypothetical protein